ncbi:MAG: ferritin-like domain-containing protein, partial [Promethearchaeota archaeon]
HAAEIEALELYKELRKEARAVGDWVTAQLVQKIYTEEEKHLLTFEEYLEMDISEPEGITVEDVESTKIYTQDYFDLLNKAVAAEISAIVQYTNQHEKASKIELRRKSDILEVITGNNKGKVVADMLKKIFMQEMDHLEKISERIYLLGGECVYNPYPLPEIGDNVDDFLMLDRKAEDYAIVLYREIIKVAGEKGDIVTKRLFESILEEEDEHYWMFDDFF